MDQLADVFIEAGRSDRVIARVVGDIDISNAVVLRREILRESPQGRAVYLDLSGVTFCDSAGLSMINSVAEGVGDAPFFLVVPPDCSVMRVLSLTGMTQIFTVREVLPD